ncbi:MAG: hypothetical protein PUD02_08190 [Eggerthellales bacterium]|nr:hypothetical protein [Eggerthellales bacterium]
MDVLRGIDVLGVERFTWGQALARVNVLQTALGLTPLEVLPPCPIVPVASVILI